MRNVNVLSLTLAAAALAAITIAGCYDPEQTGQRSGAPIGDAGPVPVADSGSLPPADGGSPEVCTLVDEDGDRYCEDAVGPDGRIASGTDPNRDGDCCDPGEQLAPGAGDCNDDVRSYSPVATEVCDNAIDEDCGESPCATPSGCPDYDALDPDCNPAASECDADVDCATGAFCVVDVRCADHRCIAGTPRVCDDGNPRTTDNCNEVTDRCDYTSLPDCTSDTTCADGLYCNGSERCVGGVCVAGTRVSCDDGNDRTIDACSEVGRICTYVPTADCISNVDCDDGIFCNGAERCNTVTGTCRVGTVPTCSDGDPLTEDRCSPATDECVHDFSGYCRVDADCDDGRWCTGTELCTGGICRDGTTRTCNDGVSATDDSCNEALDRCDNISRVECTSGASRGCMTSCGGDVGSQVCGSDGRWPSACSPPAERCANSHDDDCDGLVDEACASTTYYRDADGDGYGRNDVTVTTPTSGYTTISGDCNDSNAEVHPGHAEICGNGLDDDCNGGELPCASSVTYYRDADGDLYGRNDVTQTSSSGAPSGYVAVSGDCNDSLASVHPGAADVCPSDGLDNDCSGGDMTACGTTCTMTDVVTVRVGSPGSSAYRISYNMEAATCSREYREVVDSSLPIETSVQSRDGLYMVQIQQTSSGQWFSYMETSTPFSPIFLRGSWGVVIQVNSSTCSFPTIPSGGYTPPTTIAPGACEPCYDSVGWPNVCVNTSSSTRELRCNDGVDNDADGRTDAADEDCGRWS